MTPALFRALPPVGSSAPLLADPHAPSLDLTCSGAYHPLFVDSGTSALALALGFARHRHPRAGNHALLPAYGCPDLVAAAVHAGVRAQLVDVEAETPWLSLDDVKRRVDTSTALVAVNFLGMPERLDALGKIARNARVPLIEDSAQMAPFSGNTVPRGDLVVYSFGRGKPFSLLAGGALLVRSDWAEEFRRWLPATIASRSSTSAYLLKCAAYRLVTQPRVFVWARRLPFLRLGQVAYSPLERIDAMPLPAFERLASGFAKMSREPGAVQRALDDALEGHRGHLVNLPAQLGSSHFPLLRYPLLARDTRERDALVARLDKSGLGASSFYGRALAEIPGLPSLDRTRTPEAVRFAARLLTLPVHSDVRMRDVETMKSVLRAT